MIFDDLLLDQELILLLLDGQHLLVLPSLDSICQFLHGISLFDNLIHHLLHLSLHSLDSVLTLPNLGFSLLFLFFPYLDPFRLFLFGLHFKLLFLPLKFLFLHYPQLLIILTLLEMWLIFGWLL